MPCRSSQNAKDTNRYRSQRTEQTESPSPNTTPTLSILAPRWSTPAPAVLDPAGPACPFLSSLGSLTFRKLAIPREELRDDFDAGGSK